MLLRNVIKTAFLILVREPKHNDKNPNVAPDDIQLNTSARQLYDKEKLFGAPVLILLFFSYFFTF